MQRLSESPVSGDQAPQAAGSRRRRWVTVGLAVVVVGAVALVLSRGGDPSVGTAREINSAVEVRSEGNRFVPVRDHPEVRAGDVVRTNDSGLGVIDYGDGSKTRLDADTTFEVDELLTVSDRVVKAKLTKGRVWNNVKKLTSSNDRFEVRTPNAVATVRGTVFVCETIPLGLGAFETTCAQVTGRTDVVFTNGATSSLGPGECVTNGGPCKYTPAQLNAMLATFAALDGVTLPWSSEEAGEPVGETEEVVARVGAGARQNSGPPETAEERTRRPSLQNHDDADDDSGNRDDTGSPSSGPSLGEDSGDSGGEDSTDSGDSGDDGDDDGDEGSNDDGDEGDDNNGCGDAEGGGRGGGCPHNGS